MVAENGLNTSYGKAFAEGKIYHGTRIRVNFG
jgi:hypothetical protein